MHFIYHITQRAAWEQAQTAGGYRGDTLSSDGFIHCSRHEQVADVANAIFQGEPDLVLLRIDEAKVKPQIRYEDCYEAGETFPHIYGPLNLDAVVDIIDFPPLDDGTFRF